MAKTRQKVRLIQKTVTRCHDGVKRREKTSTWYLDFGHGDVRSTGIADRRVAEQLRAREEAKLVLSLHGLPDPVNHRKLLTDHLKDYEAKMTAEGSTDRHVATSMSMIRKIIKAGSWRTVANINEIDVNRYVVVLKEKATANTVHNHLMALSGFVRWLVEHGKLSTNPLTRMKKPSPIRETDRRMLLPDEWHELRRALLVEGRERHWMTANERVVLYATAIQTGLRADELRSLSTSQLYLDGDPPFIICSARKTKNKKDCKQYIKPDLAVELRANLDGGLVFPNMPDRGRVAGMIRADLAAARVAWVGEAKNEEERAQRERSDFLLAVNQAGEYFDFHSLRHSCGAWLALSGCHPKVVQTVMRHANINLTMGTYGHLFPGQVPDAIAKLPNMFGG